MGTGESPGAEKPGARARKARAPRTGAQEEKRAGSPVRVTRAAFAAAPRALAAAAVLVAAQGLLLVGLGVLQVVRGFGRDIDDLGRAEFGGVISLFGGVVVLALARTLVVNRAASKSPVIVIQLLCLPVGWAMADNGLYGYGIPLLVVAAAILGLLALNGLRHRDAPPTP
ncbi:hypothetical protein I6A84_11355 [Frankia sp. CNm7]|uniref:hypothetical protein n=1 Tax=Frankia nepalensis TaxID=1836974 RepID=UPI001931400C|nr:hypothetical protein [Frankia nepalensis]MBL7518693.1 hypothetical protein [Frankia nepalensis]